MTRNFPKPADDQPLRRLVMRSASFSKEDFEELLAHHGQFHGELQVQGWFKVGGSMFGNLWVWDSLCL